MTTPNRHPAFLLLALPSVAVGATPPPSDAYGLAERSLTQGVALTAAADYSTGPFPDDPVRGYRGGRFGDANALFFLARMAGREMSYAEFCRMIAGAEADLGATAPNAGAPLERVIRLGTRIGLTPALRQLTRAELEAMPLPIVLHLEIAGPSSGRLYTLVRRETEAAWVVDCRSFETARVPNEELARAWTGVVVLNDPAPQRAGWPIPIVAGAGTLAGLAVTSLTRRWTK